MARAERKPIMGVWGLYPQGCPGAKPLEEDSGGFVPLELTRV